MPARIEDRSLEQLVGYKTPERADDVRLALLLTYITLGWMTIEGAASLLLGWASKVFFSKHSASTVLSNSSARPFYCGVCGQRQAGARMRREWKQWNIVHLDWLVTPCISSLPTLFSIRLMAFS